MPLIARQRSRLAVLAVLALVGSLLAVSAVPAVAVADDTADEKADNSACVAAATEDAGFTDMDNSFAAAEANCLAHYGITLGTGNSMFSPQAAVTRLQMARFLSRAAGPAGIDTMGVESQGLIDILDMGEEAQEAVNTVVHLGIMTARADDTFDPAGIVSRRDMAVHLAAFLSNALVGPGGEDIDDLKNGRASGDTPFTDISGVSVGAHKAIRDVFELGVTTGKTDTTFAPNDPVSREQMAAFITRALAHTNARPEGISVQAVDGTTSGDVGTSHDLVVSVRDADHQPVPDALIDVISTSNPDEAFDDDGACVSTKVTGDCTVKVGDPAADPDGNADVSVTLTTPDPGTTTVKVWTGDAGDKFDNDSTDYASIELDSALPSDMINVTDDTTENSNFLKFGDTVTYTLQVVNSKDEPVADEGLEVTIRAVIEDTTTSPDRPATTTSEAVHKTDAAGQIEVSYTQSDPDGDKDNQDRVTLTLTLTRTGDPALDLSGANDQTDDADSNAATIQAIWSDADPVATTLTLSQRVMYHETNDDGVANTLMATLVDQYGDPVRSQKVAVWSDAENTDDDTFGLGGTDTEPADRRTTSRSKGVATKTYTRDVTAPATEELDAQYILVIGCVDSDTDCQTAAEPDETDDDVTIAADAVDHYWASRADGETVTGDVLVADKDNNSIVLGPDTAPRLVTYKAGDQFTITGTGAVTMDAFETALNAAGPGGTPAADNVTAIIGDDEDDINTFTINA